MSALRFTYLLLAIVGTIVPFLFYGPWVQANGFGIAALIEAWKSNLAATGLYWDMVIAAMALMVWILAETYVRKDYWTLLCIPLIFLIGISCALPLFLFLRTRPIR